MQPARGAMAREWRRAARRGGAGRGRCSPQGPVRAAPGAGCGPGRRGVAEQRLPRGSLGGGEPRV